MKAHPLVKIPVFLVLLLLLHGAISILFPVPLPAEIVEFDRYLAEGVDVLYLGDSTLMLPVGEVTTGEILQELVPEQRVGQIAHPAYGLDLFYDYVAYMERHGGRPQTLVFPINIRSFSPAWDMRPAYQFEKERRILAMGLPWTRLLLRPLEVFGFYRPSISQRDFLDAPVYNGDVLVGQVRDFETLADDEVLQGDAGNAYREVELGDAETAQAVLTYHYMFSLDPDHRKLDAMVAAAELAAECGVDVIYYITPVNVAQGEHFLGRTFRERFADNVRVVQSRLDAASGDNITLLNLAFDLPAYGLIDTEHLTEPGKEHIAEQIALVVEGAEGLASSDVPGATPTAVADPTVDTAAPTPTATEAVPTATPATPEATPETVVGGDVTGVSYIDRYWPVGTYPVDLYRITFETVDDFSEIVETQADLYIPYVEFEQAFPVLGHASGTTGIGNGCAPLDELTTGRRWGNYHGHSLAYAAEGHIVVFPNWLHFEDPERIHHYFVSSLQAQTLLDAMRAAYRFWDREQDLETLAQPAQIAFMMGYSSGGHAIFAAKDRAQDYAPELPIAGVIGFGPVTNPELLLQEDPVFGPYLVYAYRDFYGEDVIDPADVYMAHLASEFEDDVLSLCVDEIFTYYSHSARRMYLPGFREVLYNDRLDSAFPEFAERLAENTAGLAGGAEIPVLILQGTADTVITPPSQRRFVDQLCALGNPVTLFEYEAVSHGQTRWTSFENALAWMGDAVEGKAPRSDCPSPE
jgi:acetyl esterase/lipase